ncbi:MAG TPA: hypothetical protein VFG47_20815, partial [Geminicoccaceae bacterium]|nr:hypothetical protein [Geminicoccaceae bacterium]
LPALLDAAMARTYSANPGANFFTAGGLHRFANFNRDHDHRTIALSEAFRHSVNLPFIRLMRDIVEHTIADAVPDFRELLTEPRHPARREYLARFADREGTEFLDGFFRTHRGRAPDETLALLAGRVRRPTQERLAVVFRSVRPEAAPEELAEFLRGRLPEAKVDPAAAGRLHDRYGPDRFSLADRGYLAGIHPLELWLVGYLQTAPDSTRALMLQASEAERQAAYAWLFKTRHKKAQDTRIRILLEEDAFVRIGAAWRRLGYPFDRLVPSYATAIGSSGDRPAALAELIGIVLDDGVRRPSVRIERLHFAAGTPYETVVGREAGPGERVLPAEVAATVRKVLADVVENGTAKRVAGAFVGPDGSRLAVGGKTGTGDNRHQRYAADGRVIESRVINRTATFAFFIGDRFFGVITAHVAGPEAAKYDFTSSLPAQILKVLAPAFQPLIDRVEPRLAAPDAGDDDDGRTVLVERVSAHEGSVAVD